MSKEQSTEIATVTPATVAKRGKFQIVEVLASNARVQDPGAVVRMSPPGQASVDMLAEKHANNISKSLAKSAGRLAYRMACEAAGYPDPEAK
jgi:hypothetical protein